MARCPYCDERISKGVPHFCRTYNELQGVRLNDPTLPAPAFFQLERRMNLLRIEKAPANLTKSAFFKKYSQGQKYCQNAAILGYVSAAAVLIAAIRHYSGSVNIYSVIGIMLYVAFSILIQIQRSKTASILMLVLALFDIITMLFNYGGIGGFSALAAGVLAIVGAFQCTKEWKAYQARTQTATPSL